MRLFDRISLLARADAHGVLDSLEERSLLARQHLRDAEFALARKRAELQVLEDEERSLAEQTERLATRERSLDEDVELALAGGKDELARFAVRRLLQARDAVRTARARRDELAQRRERLGERLAAQEREFEELQSRVRARLAEARERSVEPQPAVAVADQEVELELLRRREAGGGGQ